MRRLHLSRFSLALLLAVVSSAPLAAVQAQRARVGNGPTVTMYAGPDFTPYGGPITTQHTHVVTALKVLAQRFQQQTGIRVSFVNPAIGSGSGNVYPDWNRYMQASIAANTAPDVALALQGISISQLGWFTNLDSALARPNSYAPDNRRWSDLYYSNMLAQPEGNGGTLGGDNHRYEIAVSGNYPFIIIGTLYNKALWRKAGITKPPTTWQEWMGQLAQLKKAGISGMAPNTTENKSGSLWPLWSTLNPPFTADLAKKADANHDGTLSTLEQAQAIMNGTVSMSDPHMQAPWLQYKRQASYYLPGWNAADIESAWSQGKVAERYGGFWELPTEKSNTGRKFDFGFFAPVPVTQATSPLITAPVKYEPIGAARLAYATYSSGFGIVSNAVKRDNNMGAAIKWLQFITTPQADEFLVNENVVGVPVVKGAHTAPLYNQLSTLPVPAYQYTTGVFPYQMYNEETSAVQHESVVWLLGQESDATFFSHIQSVIKQYAARFIVDSKKTK